MPGVLLLLDWLESSHIHIHYQSALDDWILFHSNEQAMLLDRRRNFDNAIFPERIFQAIRVHDLTRSIPLLWPMNTMTVEHRDVIVQLFYAQKYRSP